MHIICAVSISQKYLFLYIAPEPFPLAFSCSLSPHTFCHAYPKEISPYISKTFDVADSYFSAN